MKRIEKRKVFWRCEKCKVEYPDKSRAIYCEERITEKRAFKVGDRVKGVRLHLCNKKNKKYFPVGRVVKTIGPMPSDREYEIKWLEGKKERLRAHVFIYEIAFRCSWCKRKKEDSFYAPELKLFGRR